MSASADAWKWNFLTVILKYAESSLSKFAAFKSPFILNLYASSVRAIRGKVASAPNYTHNSRGTTASPTSGFPLFSENTWTMKKLDASPFFRIRNFKWSFRNSWSLIRIWIVIRVPDSSLHTFWRKLPETQKLETEGHRSNRKRKSTGYKRDKSPESRFFPSSPFSSFSLPKN